MWLSVQRSVVLSGTRSDSKRHNFTMSITGWGDGAVEAFWDAVSNFASDPGSTISGEVVYVQCNGSKPVPMTVDSIIGDEDE